nr:hypothetical protein [Mycolicibacterium komanii]
MSVGVIYRQMINVKPRTSDQTIEIRDADDGALGMLAKSLAVFVNMDGTLVDWIEKNNQTYTADEDRWYAICTAGAWLIIQTYFREILAIENGGE